MDLWGCILVISRSEDVVHLVRKAFRESYQVLSASSCEEGAEVIASGVILDAIVCEVEAEDECLRLLQKLAKQISTQLPKIVFLSKSKRPSYPRLASGRKEEEDVYHIVTPTTDWEMREILQEILW